VVDQNNPIKDRVERIFDYTSTNYDDYVEKNMILTSNLLLREVKIPENPTALDVACGTGISTLELVKRCNGLGTFIGVDISQSMINQAKQKAAANSYTDLRFLLGDAEKLDFPESSFDLVISNMSFHFFPNQRKALSEMYRVLKPGGQAALLFHGMLSDREVNDVVLRVANRHTEYPAFAENVKAFHEGFIGLEDAMKLYESVGFVDSYIFGRHRIFFEVPDLDDTNAYWGIWRSGVPLDHWGEVKDEIISEFRVLSEEQGFKNASYLIIGVGSKPAR
jgi:ubiquinone/menaquinone biosynthesis C-methylase UbiE